MSEEQEEKTLLILQKNTPEKLMELRYNELQRRGIAEPELTRAVQAEFVNYPTPTAEPWPGPVTGVDLAGNINLDLIPASKSPPVIQPNTDKTEPFPTPNVSPYGIGTTGTPYPSFATPNPNATTRPIGSSASDVLSITNFPAEPSNNWSATASKLNSEPSMEGEEGFNVTKSIPEWRYPIEDSQINFSGIEIPPITIEPSGQFNEAITKDKKKIEKARWFKKLLALLGLIGFSMSQSQIKSYLKNQGVPKEELEKIPVTPQAQKKFVASKIADAYVEKAPDDDDDDPKKRDFYFTHNIPKVMAEFVLSPSHKGKDVCDDYVGETFNLMDTHNRPILPSEGKGYTNLVHPHCHCLWRITKEKTLDSLNRKQQSEFGKIESHIEKAAKDHTLHTVKPDGDLSSRTRGTNPIIQEAIGKIRHQVKWLSDDYLTKAKETAKENNGVLYLIRAATESITDHRGEGEQYRRKLSGKELNSMARTATGKNMDINHNKDWMTGGFIPDSEYDENRKEIQMLVIETDDQINNYINDGSISAVSINGGNPRTQSVEPCNENCKGNNCEMCNTPHGVILGELDDIAMTWVVTNPSGIMWRGEHIASATPGIKSTIIEIL